MDYYCPEIPGLQSNHIPVPCRAVMFKFGEHTKKQMQTEFCENDVLTLPSLC